ncbi:MAG: GPW/gp25 family protein [Roseburia sp.]|nr:GPW/gp25 family protein [Roseburia sp.]
MEKKSHLGRGLKFPIEINKATGRFCMSGEKESVKEAVYLILMTQKGERFVRTDFGSNILSYTFMDVSDTRVHMMAKALQDTIEEQEPRVSQVEVKAEQRPDKGCLIFYVSYRITETNTRDNLVFPFYLYGQGGE